MGLGSIGKRHLRLARELMPHADIRVLRHQFAEGVPEYSDGVFFKLNDAINFSPQIAVIASPAPFHLSTAKALANIGVDLLIEKPLSSTLIGVTELLEECEKNSVVLLLGYNLRFLESLQYYKNLLSENAIGRVLSVRCEIGQYLPSWRPECDYRQGVSARQNLGGGVLLELSHEIDYLSWIFGEIDWVKATLSRQSSLDIDVEDTAHLTFGFLSIVDGRQLIGNLSLDFIRHDKTRLCVAIGEKGTLSWNGLTGEISLYENGSQEWRKLFCEQHHRDDSYFAEWRNFLECVEQRKSPLVTGNDGLKVLQIIEAARSSQISNGCMVKVQKI